MRWAYALSWLWVTAVVWAVPPMDLESPFIKTALIKEKTGEEVSESVLRGKVAGEFVELEKEQGGLLVIPVTQVLAVLPRLPNESLSFQQSDAHRAKDFLSKLQDQFPGRPELSPECLAQWAQLAQATTESDLEQGKALEAWFLASGNLSPQAKPEEIGRLVNEGKSFARKFPEQSKKIMDHVRGIESAAKIDLGKVQNLSVPLGPLGGGLVTGLALWALLLIPGLVVAKALADGLRGLREGNLPAGGGGLLVALLAGALLAALLWPPPPQETPGESSSASQSKTSARRALWFSRNLMEGWSDQSENKISLPPREWGQTVLETLQPGEEDTGILLWKIDKPSLSIHEGRVFLDQPVVMKVVSLVLRFTFLRPAAEQSWLAAELDGFQIGRLPLGRAAGSLALEILGSAYDPVKLDYGLGRGVLWRAGQGEAMVVEIPPARRKRPEAKESLGAQELAEVYDQGFGDVYVGKVITVEGNLVEVYSFQDTLGESGIRKEDPMDEFVLEGIPEQPGRLRALKVRGQFRSPSFYFLDGKGDLFAKNSEASNADTPSQSVLGGQKVVEPASKKKDDLGAPILRKEGGVTKVRLALGRVESAPDENRLITLYDCRKIEGWEGGKWKEIWKSGP